MPRGARDTGQGPIVRARVLIPGWAASRYRVPKSIGDMLVPSGGVVQCRSSALRHLRRRGDTSPSRQKALTPSAVRAHPPSDPVMTPPRRRGRPHLLRQRFSSWVKDDGRRPPGMGIVRKMIRVMQESNDTEPQFDLVNETLTLRLDATTPNRLTGRGEVSPPCRPTPAVTPCRDLRFGVRAGSGCGGVPGRQ